MQDSERTSILFACGGMGIGGVQRSLLALVAALPEAEFELSVLVDSLGGSLEESLPSHVKVLVLPRDLKAILTASSLNSRTLPVILHNPRWMASALGYLLAGKGRDRRRLIERLWDRQPAAAESALLDREFDIAISFAGFMGVWNQLIAERVHAQQRILWIHGDVRRLTTGTSHERRVLGSYDHVVTVSNACAQLFKQVFPDLAGRVTVVHNILPAESLKEQAREPVPVHPLHAGIESETVRVISVGRLDRGKGYSRGLTALSSVVQEGVNIVWTLIGEGPEREVLERQIDILNLGNHVVLLGAVRNPMPWLVRSDLFFHPSESEGHSIAIEEARLFGKPVLATRYATVADQVRHGIDGIVVDFSVEEIAAALKSFATDGVLRSTLSRGAEERPLPPDPVEVFTGMVSS